MSGLPVGVAAKQLRVLPAIQARNLAKARWHCRGQAFGLAVAAFGVA